MTEWRATISTTSTASPFARVCSTVTAALSTSVSPALELHRVVGGLSLFAYFWRNLAERDVVTSAIAAIGSVLVAAGVGGRAVRWALLAVAVAVRHRLAIQEDVDDYLAIWTALWLACLPIADSFPFGYQTRPRNQLCPLRVVRGAFMTWFSLTLLLAAPWASAFGRVLSPPVIRATTALLIALLVWQPRSMARWCALSIFVVFVGGLLVQFGVTISATMLLGFAAFVWAPEIDLISGMGLCDPAPSRSPRLDAFGVLSWTMVTVFTVAVFFPGAPTGHKAFDILTGAGLEPEFGWRQASAPRAPNSQDRAAGGPW
jgi:hypothetical protein